MNLTSSIYGLLGTKGNKGIQVSKRIFPLAVGLVALVLVAVSLHTATPVVETSAELPSVADVAFARNVALIGHGPVGYVAASGPAIGQSVFPGQAVARSLALASQPSEAFARSVALIGQSLGAMAGNAATQSVFPGEAVARRTALTGQGSLGHQAARSGTPVADW
jgi:hypothetical protein